MELKRLKARLSNLDGESANVIKLVRSGICSPDDPQIASELGNIAAQKTAVSADIALVERQLADGNLAITPEILDKFGALLTSKLGSKDKRFRREYLRLLVDRVEVGHHRIRITGTKDALAAAASGRAPHLVPKAEREWCTQLDSNQWPSD